LHFYTSLWIHYYRKISDCISQGLFNYLLVTNTT